MFFSIPVATHEKRLGDCVMSCNAAAGTSSGVNVMKPEPWQALAEAALLGLGGAGWEEHEVSEIQCQNLLLPPT